MAPVVLGTYRVTILPRYDPRYGESSAGVSGGGFPPKRGNPPIRRVAGNLMYSPLARFTTLCYNGGLQLEWGLWHRACIGGRTLADKLWKRFERQVASVFGGERRGAHTSDSSGRGVSDVVGIDDKLLPWSIEVKCHTSLGYAKLLDAAHQAEAARRHAIQIPLAVAKRPGDDCRDALVVMRLETFARWQKLSASP